METKPIDTTSVLVDAAIYLAKHGDPKGATQLLDAEIAVREKCSWWPMPKYTFDDFLRDERTRRAKKFGILGKFLNGIEIFLERMLR